MHKALSKLFSCTFSSLFSPRVSCVISYLLDAMQGCSNVTVREKGSHDRNSNRYSSLPCSKLTQYMIDQILNALLVRFTLFPKVAEHLLFTKGFMTSKHTRHQSIKHCLPPQQLKLKQPVIKCHHYNKQDVSLTGSRSFQVAK